MKRRALCLIRHAVVYRREAFVAGLRAAGYAVCDAISQPQPGDVLVIWNRYGSTDEMARRFERAGAAVVVCENGYLGNGWMGERWVAMALNHHCGAGRWVEGGPERWDALEVPMQPFRWTGTELVILGQRGIGEAELASPRDWAQSVQHRYGGRLRPHPGSDVGEGKVPLEQDLRAAAGVITWASSAALKALLLGVPVWYACPTWIGARAAAPLRDYGKVQANRSEACRLATFRRLAWAQWRIGEVASGEAFAWLLQSTQTAVAA